MKRKMNIWNRTPITETSETSQIRQNQPSNTRPRRDLFGIDDDTTDEMVQFDPNYDPSTYSRQAENPSRSVLNIKQKRRSSLSISVSEEEAQILRAAASEKGVTFSKWARAVLFRSAGKRIPKRPI